MDLAHRSFSYPLAYAAIILPLSIMRWLQFSKFNNHYNVPAAATLFSSTLLNLSGAINVLLFLVFKPGLLLFSRPDQLTQPDHELVQVVPVGNGSGIFTDPPNIHHSPEPTTTVLADDLEGTGLTCANHKQTLDEIVYDRKVPYEPKAQFFGNDSDHLGILSKAWGN